MSRDRITPVDPVRLARERASAARKRQAPPPLPDRSKTPESGGLPAQRLPPRELPKVENEIVPPLSHAPKSGDWRRLVFNISARLATGIVAGMLLVIAALSYWAVSAINAKREALDREQQTKQRAEDREEQWQAWVDAVLQTLDCRDRRDVETGEMLRPDPQRMGAARRLEPWRNDCLTKLPPRPR